MSKSACLVHTPLASSRSPICARVNPSGMVTSTVWRPWGSSLEEGVWGVVDGVSGAVEESVFDSGSCDEGKSLCSGSDWGALASSDCSGSEDDGPLTTPPSVQAERDNPSKTANMVIPIRFI